MGNATLANAIAAAVPAAEAELAGKVTPAPTEVTTTPVVEDPAKEEKPTPVSQEVQTEVAPEEEAAEETPVPTSLYGIDLSVLPDDEARKTFISEFTETQQHIGKLQRENAALRNSEPVPPVAPAVVAEQEQPDLSTLSDEQLAEALGINLEDALDPQATKLNLALTRKVLALTQTVERVSTSTATDAMQRTWETALDGLESKFGELPVERIEVLEYAATNGITDPEAAYWAKAGPIRFAVNEALGERLKSSRVAAKKSATTVRPKTSVGVEPRLESKNVKDAVREAANAAMRELGITFKD